jgi:hypothetical protein
MIMAGEWAEKNLRYYLKIQARLRGDNKSQVVIDKHHRETLIRNLERVTPLLKRDGVLPSVEELNEYLENS